MKNSVFLFSQPTSRRRTTKRCSPPADPANSRPTTGSVARRIPCARVWGSSPNRPSATSSNSWRRTDAGWTVTSCVSSVVWRRANPSIRSADSSSPTSCPMTPFSCLSRLSGILVSRIRIYHLHIDKKYIYTTCVLCP